MSSTISEENNVGENDTVDNEPPVGSRELGVKKSFFLWLAAVNHKTLEHCPESEVTRQSAIGATVLIPTLFSVVASSYIALNLNLNIYLQILIPIIWCFVILTLDRALLATYQAKLIQVIFRILLAVVVSVTISHPVTLSIFHEIIENKVTEKYKEPQINTLNVRLDKKKASFDEKITNLKKQRKDISEEMKECNSDPLNTKKYSDRTVALNAEREKFSSEIEVIYAKMQAKHLKATRESRGKGKSGIRGKGRIYNGIIREIEKLSREINYRNGMIRKIESQITKSMISDAENITEAQNKRRSHCNSIEKYIYKKRKKIEEDFEKYQGEFFSEEKDISGKISNIDSKESDILQKTLALHDIFKDKVNGGNLAELVFIAFILLFILIDIIPILIKIFSKGCYEYQVQFSQMELEQKSREYPKLLKKITSRQIEMEIKLKNEQKILNSISTIMKDKNEMLYDFLDMRKKYLSYLKKHFGLDKDKIIEIIKSENIDLAKLVKKDNESIINEFFSARFNIDKEEKSSSEKEKNT